jgi:DNA-binding NarL/FixJ family response regulator
MTHATSTIGIVEDDDNLRGFLASIIDVSDGLNLAFSVSTVREGLAQLDGQPIDLCLVDLNLPDGSGVEVIKAVKHRPDAKALVLSVLGDRVTVMEALGAGADGYILKSGRPEHIIREIRQTLDGLAPVSPQIASYLLELARPTNGPTAKTTLSGEGPELTSRECQLLDLFARGLSYRETAETLDISVNTVSDHVRKIYAKLSVHSRSEAVFEAQSLGLIDGVQPAKPAEKTE